MCRGQSEDGSFMKLQFRIQKHYLVCRGSRNPEPALLPGRALQGLLLVFAVWVSTSLPFVLYNLLTRQSSSHCSVIEAAIPSQKINPGEWMPTSNVFIWVYGNAPFKPQLQIMVNFRWVSLAVSPLLLWSRIQSRNLLFSGQPSHAGVSD